MEVSSQLHALSALPHGKGPLYPLNRFVGPQNLSAQFRGKKNLLVLLVNKPKDGHSFSDSVIAVGRLGIGAHACCKVEAPFIIWSIIRQLCVYHAGILITFCTFSLYNFPPSIDFSFNTM